jgi:hypothetical protein
LDLQGKDHRSPLFQTSLSPREAVGGRQTAFSRTTHMLFLNGLTLLNLKCNGSQPN